MIENIVQDFLQGKLGQIPVRLEREEELPGKYVIIEKTGSGEENHIYTATFAVQSYADSLYEAAALNSLIIGYMEALPDERDVFSCELNSDYNFTDTTFRKYRYQAVFDIVY